VEPDKSLISGDVVLNEWPARFGGQLDHWVQIPSPRLEMHTARHIHLWRAVTLWLAAGCAVLSGYSGGSKNCVNFAVLDHLFR
jgi:hypothetical protein